MYDFTFLVSLVGTNVLAVPPHLKELIRARLFIQLTLQLF